jgi:2-polyprenyl-3-methyl-5-hydroxy-6-metoxy-1,4-benzoquinol methylase
VNPIAPMATQRVFTTVYRGRQSSLHHMAYMRMAKVLLIQEVLARAGIELAGKSLFDYGFGAGTFFRYCPRTTQLFGVEMDPIAVAEVSRMLQQGGHEQVSLAAIDIACWQDHPFWRRSYNVVLCSHVLEHLDDPVALLRRLRQCLRPDGALVVVLPLNELRENPHHVHRVDRPTLEGWLAASTLHLRCYLEADPWSYWLQPLYAPKAGASARLAHLTAQALSLGVGIPATLIGHGRWQRWSLPFARLSGAKPGQVALVCGPSSSAEPPG